jgi:hypothetical protein
MKTTWLWLLMTTPAMARGHHHWHHGWTPPDVPEPSTVLLFGTGLIVLMLVRKRNG